MESEATTNVETVEKKIIVGKESSEVVDALGKLIADIKAGKEVGTIAVESLPSLMKAVEGYEMLDDEMKHKTRNATIAYSGLVLADALAPAK